MKRLFFGLAPDQQALRQCLSLMQAIRGSGCRVIPAANLHLTLLFVGAVSAEQETALIESAETIRFAPLSQGFEHLSYWPKPQVLCLTASRTDSGLQTLAEQLKSRAESLGIAVECCLYQPHVTLARKAKRPIDMDIEPLVWQAERFYLFESVSTGGGVAYRKSHCWYARSG